MAETTKEAPYHSFTMLIHHSLPAIGPALCQGGVCIQRLRDFCRYWNSEWCWGGTRANYPDGV